MSAAAARAGLGAPPGPAPRAGPAAGRRVRGPGGRARWPPAPPGGAALSAPPHRGPGQPQQLPAQQQQASPGTSSGATSASERAAARVERIREAIRAEAAAALEAQRTAVRKEIADKLAALGVPPELAASPEERRARAEAAAAHAARAAAATADARAARIDASMAHALDRAHQVLETAAREAALVQAHEALCSEQAARLAGARTGQLFFVVPEELPAGKPARLYVDRSWSPVLANASRARASAGFSGWALPGGELELRPSGLRNSSGKEWWAAEFRVPADAYNFEFVLTDGANNWDNNNKQNYRVDKISGGPTREQFEAARAAAAAAASQAAAEAAMAAELEAEEVRRVSAEIARNAARAGEAAREAADSKPGVWATRPSAALSTEAIELYYNAAATRLRGATSLNLHVGVNAWSSKALVAEGSGEATIEAPLAMARAPAPPEGAPPGEWWTAALRVPANACCVDFVVSDGRNVFDNNDNRDYHVVVDKGCAVARALARARALVRLREAEAAARAARSEARRAANRGVAEAAYRASLRGFLYSKPEIPRAGGEVTIFYDPSKTALRGNSEVYLRGSWNRWAHPAVFGPLPLQASPFGSPFMTVTVPVPADAHVMDFVLSNRSADQPGAALDDRGGLDYHLPTAGASGPPPRPLRVAHVAVEVAPIAKVGGLGDVITSLGRAMVDEGHAVEVLLPKYDCLDYSQVSKLRGLGAFRWSNADVRVFAGCVEGLPVTFLEPQNGMFSVGCIYGRADDHVRFGFFCGAAMAWLRERPDVAPDVVHCHDWTSAPVTWLAKEGSKTFRTVFTLHNLQYGADLVGRAMAAADVATTVSPTYAHEVREHASIKPNVHKMHGIRNGIDLELWGPEGDLSLPQQFDAAACLVGKDAARRGLRRRLRLVDADKPVVGVVTRLTAQKGVALLKHACWRTLEQGGQFVLVGTAPEANVQAEFRALAEEAAKRYPNDCRLVFAFDEDLSRLLYAAADLILVPSIFEPCGLTQMIAMRYGAVPLVRRTGGLADTVFDVASDAERAARYGTEPNGYVFEGSQPGDLEGALDRALADFRERRPAFEALQERVMRQDWSWGQPALEYVDVYHSALRIGSAARRK